MPLIPKPSSVAHAQAMFDDHRRRFASPLRMAIDAYVTAGQHQPTLDTINSASMLSERNECVTITGPTGTGKELIARILHGNRPPETFKVANCAGLVDTLFQSQLFGYVRGAFTGAQTDRPGLITAAKNGTVFLDEIGDMPLHQQAALLRVLQERKVQPVGSVEEIPVSCRFIFATHRNLSDMVDAGTFREDLYYRINEFTLTTYALSERLGDAELIAKKLAVLNKWSFDGPIPSEVYAKGNTRALRNWLLQKNVLGL